jgi:putative membrane protein
VDFVSLLAWLVGAAIVLLIVDRFNIGVKVGGFVNALVAAVVIAVLAYILNWILGSLGITFGGGILGAIMMLIAAAVVLMFAGRILKGFSVSGFSGALIGAIAIAVVSWILYYLVNLLF